MPREGESFDRYRIEAVLGEGGMGIVYRAFDPRLNRRVALKVVRGAEPSDEPSATTDATARLVREARAAAALDHPNAVAIFDVGEVDGEAFIAMELVNGRPLRAFVGETSVPMATRLRWLIEVARVLGAAHKAGLVHRDVKPENVMIRDDGGVKVLDFGIARRLSRSMPPPPQGFDAMSPFANTLDGFGTLTHAGKMMGTPLYMAPEQIQAMPVDGRTDQFAWGAMAYELLSGQMPWRADGSVNVGVAAIVLTDPPPLRALAPDVPTVAADVITRALRKEPRDRFPSMEALLDSLEPVAGASSAKVLPAGKPTDPMLPFVNTVTTSRVPSRMPGPPESVRSRGRARTVGGVTAIAAIVAGLALVARGRTSHVAPAAPASPEAASAYAVALSARHDGMSRIAAENLRRVLAVEPNFAPAILRLALLDYGTGEDLRDARELFQRVTPLRASLTEAEQAILDGLSPCVLHDDVAHAECEARLRAAGDRHPTDLDVLAELAGQQSFESHLDDAIATCKRALAIDPTFVRMMGLLGELEAYVGRQEDAIRTLEECTHLRPAATSCIDYRIWVHTQRDECEAVERDARDWVAASAHDGGRWGPQHYLANAQLALGRPLDAVRETLAQEWAKDDPGERASTEATDRAMLAVATGDFAEAEAQIDALEKLASTDYTLDAHAVPALLRVQLLEEEGRVAEMGAAAESFRSRGESWTADTRDDDWEIAKDVTMRIDDALLRAGRIDPAERAKRRTAWLARWQRTHNAPFAWFQAWAFGARTPDDAREAERAIPPGGLPPFRPFVYAEGAMGRMALLEGDVARAVPLLEHATRGCYALEDPFTTVQSHLWLGEALEARGDRGRACAEYAWVAARWGSAKRPSVTADEAKRRAAAARCPPP